MAQSYETLNLIEEITRKDGSQYYEISNIDQNGIAELAANHGYIKQVKILKINIARTEPLITYEKYINRTYHLQTLVNEDDWKHPKWVEWKKPKGKIFDSYQAILKANKIG